VRRLLAALLLASAPALADEAGPLPGEVVTRIGQVAALPADARKVPGYAGAWRRAAAQQQVIERIKALGAVSVRKLSGIEETLKFPLPKGLKLDGTGQAADDGE